MFVHKAISCASVHAPVRAHPMDFLLVAEILHNNAYYPEVATEKHVGILLLPQIYQDMMST